MANKKIRLTGKNVEPQTYDYADLKYAVGTMVRHNNDSVLTDCDNGDFLAVYKNGTLKLYVESGSCGVLAVGTYNDGYSIDSTGMDWFDCMEDAVRHGQARIADPDDYTNWVNIVDVRSCVVLGKVWESNEVEYSGCSEFVDHVGLTQCVNFSG